MHVPILMVLDAYFCQSDPQYDANKNDKRKKLILVSFLISLIWGSVPLFGYPKMTFEPSQVSCSVYEAKPGLDYIGFIMCCWFFFEIIPLLIFAFCKVSTKDHKETFARVIKISVLNIKFNFLIMKLILILFKHFLAIITLIIAWGPLTTMYLWPIFGNPENMPSRLPLYAPSFAKLTALVLPVVLNY